MIFSWKCFATLIIATKTSSTILCESAITISISITQNLKFFSDIYTEMLVFSAFYIKFTEFMILYKRRNRTTQRNTFEWSSFVIFDTPQSIPFRTKLLKFSTPNMKFSTFTSFIGFLIFLISFKSRFKSALKEW